MTITITFWGVLLVAVTIATVIMGFMLAELFAFKRWAKEQNEYRKNQDDRQDNRVDRLQIELRDTQQALAKFNGAFLPVVTAWAANQNAPRSAPKSEG